MQCPVLRRINKVGILVAVVTGIPIASLGFASQLSKDELDGVALILGGIGLAAFLIAGWHLISAIRIRDVKLGVPYQELRDSCSRYEDRVVQEWIADILVESSEFNYQEGLKKAGNLQRILPFLVAEVVFLLAANGYILIQKL